MKYQDPQLQPKTGSDLPLSFEEHPSPLQEVREFFENNVKIDVILQVLSK